MLSSAFLWAVTEFGLPACSMIVSLLISKYLQYKEHEGLATLVTGSTSLMFLFLWIFPRLDNLCNMALSLGNSSINIMSSGGSLIPYWGGCDFKIDFDSHALYSELGRWATNAIKQGQGILDIISK
jgi:hypothetical protein